MKLYDYFRSTACYRVRIVLNLKQITYETVSVHLLNHGGEQHAPEYLKYNPQGLVPTLEINGQYLSQSIAIINYLDKTYPQPPLFSDDALLCARIESLALLIACDLHPLNNLRITKYLKNELHASEQQTIIWYHHWLKQGFDAFEAQLRSHHSDGRFCINNKLSLADVCLVPQVYNAQRFHFDMHDYPLIQQINHHCLSLEAFTKAAPIAE